MPLTFHLEYMQIVEALLDVDQEMRSLCEAMSSLYEFAGPLDAMSKNHQEFDSTLVEVVKQVLHQTIECALFIQEHGGKGFRSYTQYYGLTLLTGQYTSPVMKLKFNEFRDAFTSLGNSLDMGLGVQTPLASIHVPPSIPDVQELGTCTLRSYLPVTFILTST